MVTTHPGISQCGLELHWLLSSLAVFSFPSSKSFDCRQYPKCCADTIVCFHLPPLNSFKDVLLLTSSFHLVFSVPVLLNFIFNFSF